MSMRGRNIMLSVCPVEQRLRNRTDVLRARDEVNSNRVETDVGIKEVEELSFRTSVRTKMVVWPQTGGPVLALCRA
jgi:hypothetical protein